MYGGGTGAARAGEAGVGVVIGACRDVKALRGPHGAIQGGDGERGYYMGVAHCV